MKRLCSLLSVIGVLAWGSMGLAQSTDEMERSMQAMQQRMEKQAQEMRQQMEERNLEMQQRMHGLSSLRSEIQRGASSSHSDGYESMQNERLLRETEGWIKRWWAWIIALPLAVFFFFFCLGVAVEIFWVWMFIDCLLNEPLDNGQKILWAVVLWFTNLFGAIVYFFVRYRERRRVSPPPAPPSPNNQPFSYLSASTHG